MTIEEAKAIDLREFLTAIDCREVKTRGRNHWYRSPFRDENDASFKVNAERNEWFDFGIDKGGNIIELGKMLYNTSYISDKLLRYRRHGNNFSALTTRKSSLSLFQKLEYRYWIVRYVLARWMK